MLYQKLFGFRPKSPSISARPSLEDDPTDIETLTFQGSAVSSDLSDDPFEFDACDTRDLGLVPEHVTLNDSWDSPFND